MNGNIVDFLPQAPDILTISEAAEILRVGTSTIEKLLRSGQIRYANIEEHVLIPKIYLQSFLEKSCQICYTKEAKASDPSHLDNRIETNCMPLSEGDTEMATKVNQPIMINGVKHWVTANSAQEFADKVTQLLTTPQEVGKHPFDTYAWNWYNTYSAPNVETATATTYKRQLTRYLCPAFDGLAVEDITPDDVQRLFNGMAGAKATKDKARMVLNQIMDAAVEDKLIPSNPVKSRRVKITGKASKATPPYTVEQMRYLVQHIGDVKNPEDRAFLAMLSLHPMRLEEVLGLHPEDVNREGMAIHIYRAVTHPTRNQPEVKDTKTDSSHRTIGLSALAVQYLPTDAKGPFLFGGNKPMTYTQVRKMCDRIKRDTGFEENITPIRFRTTVLTDLYDQTKDIKLTQQAAGHTTSAMTLKYYVKGRETSSKATAAVDRAYTT